MKLLLADDHTLFRDALLQYILRAEPDSEVKLARDLHEAMDILEGCSEIDAVLLDLRMPGMDGMAGIRKLRDSYPDIPVALMSGVAEKHDVEQALELGASGYFPKTLSGKALVKGIKRVVEGETFVPVDHNTNDILPSYYDGRDPRIEGRTQGLSDQTQASFEGSDAAESLTPREREVVSYLMRGASNKEIARDLGLQVVTVKLHVRGVCRKLGAQNRTQAALIATRIGLNKVS